MNDRNESDNLRQEQQVKHFDLSEESSKRPEGEAATIAARQSESDDLNEETGRGPVDSPDDSFFGENKLSTSLDDE